MSIPPYSPQLNAAEVIIGVIKGKLRKAWLEAKPLSLRLVRKILDEITDKT
jgi:hypothetical protein